jgi:hypothetical protein
MTLEDINLFDIVISLVLFAPSYLFPLVYFLCN